MTREPYRALFNRRHAAELRISGAAITLPGSAQAVAAGCTCNPRRNNNGLGRALPNDQVLLVISYDCPLHEVHVCPRFGTRVSAVSAHRNGGSTW